jgi:hypothetical protein
MPVSFAKVAGDIHRNRKVRKAGRLAREVYLWVLCQNALHDRDGWVPLADLQDAAYLADELMCDESDASDGVRHSVTAGLLRINGDRVEIVGWDEDWSRRALSGAERMAKYRERRSSLPSQVTTSDATVTDRHCDAREERRREEREKKKDTRAREGPMPEGWEPNPQHLEQAGKLGVDCSAEADAFRDHHSSKGSRFVDWDAAFRTWLRNAAKFSQPRLAIVPKQQQWTPPKSRKLP